jgi:hypothetical protein
MQAVTLHSTSGRAVKDGGAGKNKKGGVRQLSLNGLLMEFNKSVTALPTCVSV